MGKHSWRDKGLGSERRASILLIYAIKLKMNSNKPWWLFTIFSKVLGMLAFVIANMEKIRF
jgi:hypothetical protein